MHPVPALDPFKLAESICRVYGIPVVNVEYMPVGFVGWHYLVTSEQGDRYFAALFGGSRLARISASRLDFSLSLSYHLAESGLFNNLAAPIRTLDGLLNNEFMGWPLVLYPYIEGHLLADERPLSNQVQMDLGRLVARLHAATPQAELVDPIKEQYQVDFEDQLRQGFEALELISSSDRPGKLRLKAMLLPRKAETLQALDHLLSMARSLRRSSHPMVICHTDIHPWNIIRTPQGRLVIVDWEGVCLAPPEYDLFIFTGPGFEVFLGSYFQSGGVQELDPERFAYYFYRRSLEDLTDFIVRILYENDDPKVDQSDLEGVQEIIDHAPELATSGLRMGDILDQFA